MAIRYMKNTTPLRLYDHAKHQAKNILGIQFGQNRSGVCVLNVAEGTVEPLLNKVEGASQRYVILDHGSYSIGEISKQLDAIAIDHNAVGYLAGYPDDPYHRRDPKNGFHEKRHLLGLDATKDHTGRYFSLISNRNSTNVPEMLFYLANKSFPKHDELKTMAAVVITKGLMRLAEGSGEACERANYRAYKDYKESQDFMISIYSELGCFDRFSSLISRTKKD